MIGSQGSSEIVFECDSSLHGYGATYDDDWHCGAWESGMSSTLDLHNHLAKEPAPMDSDNINVLELYPVFVSLLRWGHLWRNSRVVCKSDNTQVVWALTKGRSVNDMSMALLRKIFWLSVLMNFHLVAEHIPGDENLWPDTLSRLRSSTVPVSLPNYMCCYRATSDAVGSGSQGGGAQNARTCSEFMADPLISVEILSNFL